MKLSKEIPDGIKNLLEIEQGLFEKLSKDAYELYKKGLFKMLFAGSAFTLTIPNREEQLLAEKYKVSVEQINDFFYSFLYCIHFLLSDEVDEFSKLLPATSAKVFREKMKVVSEIVEKDSALRNSFHLYNSSKIPFFSDISWEAGIKVFYSSQEHVATPPQVPAGRIKIALEEPVRTPPKSLAFTFEISLKDVESMIAALEDLRKALKNLEDAKIVQQKAE